MSFQKGDKVKIVGNNGLTYEGIYDILVRSSNGYTHKLTDLSCPSTGWYAPYYDFNERLIKSISLAGAGTTSLTKSMFILGQRYKIESRLWGPGFWVEGDFTGFDKDPYGNDRMNFENTIDQGNPIISKNLWTIALPHVTKATPTTAFPMGNPNFNNIKRFSPDLSYSSDGVVNLTTNKKKCTCEMRTLSMNGCQCGAHEAEMKAKYGKDWTKPHWR